MIRTYAIKNMFSPPYGDGTELERGVKVQRVVFVPLRGIILLYHTLSQKKRIEHRRSANEIEKVSHKDHLDSAEAVDAASKP